MNHQAHPFRIRFGLLFLTALLLLGLPALAQPASAADGWAEEIQLDGKFEGGTFTLDSNTSELFRVTAAAPGESWSGTISISNHTGREMEVALLSIASQLDDLTLYNALMLDLSIGGEVVYSGIYGETPNPVTQYYIIPNGDSIKLEATVSLPAHIGNEMMGKAMDSIWTFEAHIPDYSLPMCSYTVRYLDRETEAELAPTKTGSSTLGGFITEEALSIDGYTPDEEEKTVLLRTSNQEIIFYYDKVPAEDPGNAPMPALIDDEPDPTPSEPPSEPPGVQTGHDLTESNTLAVAYLLVALLCILAALVLALQIRQSKKHSDRQ